MSFKLSIPHTNGDNLEVDIELGGYLFVLGANGSGKSSIMHKFYKAHNKSSRRITAHRQTWFSSGSLTLSPEGKRHAEKYIQNSDESLDSRWKENHSNDRTSIVICDLVYAENKSDRSIAGAVRDGDLKLAENLAKDNAPIKIINELLNLSNMSIEISIRKNEEVVASKNGCEPYSIAKLSDGERNAIPIAANVLTVDEGTLILIDEPERRLHRSIISPLLTLLFEKCPDCAFVVSTHEVMLPLDNPNAKTLLLRDYKYQGNQSAWDADLIDPKDSIDESLKKDILGARRKILFIEGEEERSLDKPLYSLIFQNVSIIAKSSCRDVEHFVTSIRKAEHLHWLKAFGIIDNDRRSTKDIETLESKGIYALSVFSLESIYYHPEIIKRIAKRQSEATEEKEEELISNAHRSAINAIRPHIQRLSKRVAEKRVREEIFSKLPGSRDISEATPINIKVDVADIIDKEKAKLQKLLDDDDLVSIISGYPIRETPALSKICADLGYNSRSIYEGAVRKFIMDDSAALAFVRTLFGSLDADINSA